MSSILYTGSHFRLLAVEQLSAAALRLRYSHDPLIVLPSGTNDALNVGNYALLGPDSNAVQSAVPVTGDPQAIDLYLEAILVPGSWTLSVSNIQSDSGASLGTPTTIDFTAVVFEAPSPLSQGALSDSEEVILRKHLNPALKGKGVDAIIAGLAVGDAYNQRLARNAFDQLYTSTSSGIYLERRLNDIGFEKPADVGMSDRAVRKLALQSTNLKLVMQAILQTLEVYYGSEHTRAFVQSTASEPYEFREGYTLALEIDGKFTTTIVFEKDDFARAGLATAVEVTAAITRGIKKAGNTAFAVAFKDPSDGQSYVRIFSGSLGLRGGVAIRGGRAQNTLLFPTQVNTLQAVGTQWRVEPATAGNGIPAGRQRYTWIGGTDPKLQRVIIGNYTNIFGSVFDEVNRGAFPIVDVTPTYFEIELTTGLEQLTVTQAATDDVLFFTPTRKTIQTVVGHATVVQGDPNRLDIILPATSTAIDRDKNTAAYLHIANPVDIDTLNRDANGLVTVNTDSAHGLGAGDWVRLDGVVPEANRGTLTYYNATTSPPSNHTYLASVTLPNGKVLVSGGIDPGTGTASKYTSVFDPSTNAWGYVSDMITARSGHTLTLLASGKVLAVGGVAGYGATCELYDYVTDTWTSTGSTSVGRSKHVAILLNNHSVFVLGGTSTLNANYELYNPATGLWTSVSTGTTSISVAEASVVTLHDSRIVVTGGYISASATISTSAFVYNPWTSEFKVIGGPSNSRYAHASYFVPRGPNGRVYIFGGTDGSVSLASIEYLDAVTLTWASAGNLLTARRRFASSTLANGRFLFSGGHDGTAVTTSSEIYSPYDNVSQVAGALPNAAELLCAQTLRDGRVVISTGYIAPSVVFEPYTSVYSAGGLNGEFRVESVPSTTQFTCFTYGYVEMTAGKASTGAVTPISAPSNGIQGPFTFDPHDGVAITDIETTTGQIIGAGQGYRLLDVADASQFPEDGGYLVFAFGTANQVTPVRYFKRVSSTQLLVDASHIFATDLPTGTTVTYLAQRGGWEPAAPENVGCFYLTASSAGRIAAEKTLEDIVGAGLNIETVVVYPGDYGLGNAGYPDSGSPKLSDRIWIWGGDNITSYVETARRD